MRSQPRARGPGAAIARGDDGLDRRIHAVLAGFDADTYSIPPRFRNAVEVAMIWSTQFAATTAGQFRKRSVWPIIERELDAFGLPRELGYVAWLESGLNTGPVGPLGQTGLWQIDRVTGLAHGLRIDSTIDERLDVRKSTHAAAQLLAEIFAELGEHATLLAVLAYPLGAGKTRAFLREIATEKGGWRSGRRSYWHFYRTHRFSAEAEAYVPRIIALILADREFPFP